MKMEIVLFEKTSRQFVNKCESFSYVLTVLLALLVLRFCLVIYGDSPEKCVLEVQMISGLYPK